MIDHALPPAQAAEVGFDQELVVLTEIGQLLSSTFELRDAFAKAHLPAEIEVYAGTQHGWCPPDSRVYNHDQAEKAWSRMLALFSNSLT